ncbi:MAG: TonB C-terminal domain-containing protein [Candidatus Melainabacteria bacterium]|nr:MAG: TonB C-terminal domain-containing protein [Candidatus Melainabacteria bacterium]
MSALKFLCLLFFISNTTLTEAKISSPQNTSTTYPPYTQPSIDFQCGEAEFMHALKLQVTKCWFPPRNEGDRKIVLRFRLNSKGEVESSTIVKISGSACFDKAAVDALYAEPFKTAIDGKIPTHEIEFTFLVSANDNSKSVELKKGLRSQAYLGDERINIDSETENLQANPSSVSSRLAIVADLLKQGSREEAIYLLEEGITLLPSKDIFSNLLNRINRREL